MGKQAINKRVRETWELSQTLAREERDSSLPLNFDFLLALRLQRESCWYGPRGDDGRTVVVVVVVVAAWQYS
jgi:hypothetical protein